MSKYGRREGSEKRNSYTSGHRSEKMRNTYNGGGGISDNEWRSSLRGNSTGGASQPRSIQPAGTREGHTIGAPRRK